MPHDLEPAPRAGRDERIASVYLFHNGHVAVFDLDGQQMEYYQNPDNRAALEQAYPPRLWHAWDKPGRCRCGRSFDDHPVRHAREDS